MAILRTMPGLNVMAPADSAELVAQLRQALDAPNPTYMRIGKKGEPPLHGGSAQLGIGRANMLRDGHDLLIVGVGPILSEAVKAAEAAAQRGVSIAVASLGGVKPLDTDFLEEMAKRFSRWISLEEHSIIGGLGSALLEWSANHTGPPIRLKCFGVPDVFIHELGSQSFTRRRLGLDAASLTQSICNEMGK